KECEYRYNIKKDNKDLYKTLLKLIRENPLKFN
ncbi:MAG: IS1595 family transposase, partial [Campylobacteraceae bacterium]|nr:IS1595 family transposase [Campylobacteraceae bacterium]